MGGRRIWVGMGIYAYGRVWVYGYIYWYIGTAWYQNGRIGGTMSEPLGGPYYTIGPRARWFLYFGAWSMQQVTGISVDHMGHVWFLNRPNAPQQNEISGDGDPAPGLCCVRGPEVIEVDQEGNVLNAWGVG